MNFNILLPNFKYIRSASCIALAAGIVLLGGCAHPIVISPPTHTLETKSGPVTNKNAAYFISKDNREKQVTTAGGGGDKVSYYPYKDLETAYYKSLSGVFNRVYTLDSLNNGEYLRSNNISFVFVPIIETESSSTGVLTWPPTDFSVTLESTVTDTGGKPVWSNRVTGKGHAEYQEFLSDFALSSKRAGEQAFKAFQDALVSAPEFGHAK